jgi:hypothetical protein
MTTPSYYLKYYRSGVYLFSNHLITVHMNIETTFYNCISSANPLGKPITMAEAEDRIFGVVLMNDCKYYCSVLYAVDITLLSSSKTNFSSVDVLINV